MGRWHLRGPLLRLLPRRGTHSGQRAQAVLQRPLPPVLPLMGLLLPARAQEWQVVDVRARVPPRAGRRLQEVQPWGPPWGGPPQPWAPPALLMAPWARRHLVGRSPQRAPLWGRGAWLGMLRDSPPAPPWAPLRALRHHLQDRPPFPRPRPQPRPWLVVELGWQQPVPRPADPVCSVQLTVNAFHLRTTQYGGPEMRRYEAIEMLKTQVLTDVYILQIPHVWPGGGGDLCGCNLRVD